jgi:lysophospholipase L1-like esterase
VATTPLQKNARVVLLGDSNTDGNSGAGGAVRWYPPLLQLVYARNQRPTPAVPRCPQITTADVGGVTFTPSGVAGNTLAMMDMAVATRVTQFNPTDVIVFGGVNDVVAGHPTATVQANWTALLTDIRAGCPALNSIVMLGCFLVGDQASGANNPSYDPALDAANAMFAAQADPLGYQFVDLRAAYFAAITTLNPSGDPGGSGLMVVGQADASCKHLTPAGADWVSHQAFAALSFAY